MRDFCDTVCSKQMDIVPSQALALGFARVALSLLNIEPSKHRHQRVPAGASFCYPRRRRLAHSV